MLCSNLCTGTAGGDSNKRCSCGSWRVECRARRSSLAWRAHLPLSAGGAWGRAWGWGGIRYTFVTQILNFKLPKRPKRNVCRTFCRATLCRSGVTNV